MITAATLFACSVTVSAAILGVFFFKYVFLSCFFYFLSWLYSFRSFITKHMLISFALAVKPAGS